MKFLSKLLLIFNNFDYFYYGLHHHFNKEVSAKKSKKIASKNLDEANNQIPNPFFAKSYDFSEQIVHPDMIFYKGKYYFAFTPYPYGMEEYENPCYCYSDSLDSLLDFRPSPIAKLQYIKRGDHYSDPALFIFNDNLYISYRLSVKHSGKDINTIFVQRVYEGNLIGSPIALIKSDDQLLSPAFFEMDEDTLCMITINDGLCFRYDYNAAFVLKTKTQIDLQGLPKDFSPWHIGISHNNDDERNKHSILNHRFIILLRNKNLHRDTLYLCEGNNDVSVIKNFDEVCLNEVFYKYNEMKFYKSCFIPNANELLVSCIDNKNRYYLSREKLKIGN